MNTVAELRTDNIETTCNHKVLDYTKLRKGTKFMIDGVTTQYTFVGFTTNGEHFIYLDPDHLWQGKDGNYDVGHIDDITEILA